MTFKHKGYALTQGSKYNYHYMIYAPDGHRVAHVPYDKPVSEKKAKEFIERYLSISEKVEYIVNDLKDDEDCF